MMKFNEFCEEILSRISIEGVSPEIGECEKDGVKINTLLLNIEGCNAVPKIPLSPIYKRLKWESFDFILERVLNTAKTAVAKTKVNYARFSDLANIPHDDIRCKLMSSSRVPAGAVTEELPGTDLVLTYQAVFTDGEVFSSVNITEGMLDVWGLSHDTMKEITCRNQTAIIEPLTSFLIRKGFISEDEVPEGVELPMDPIMISNRDCLWGAAELANPETIAKIVKRIGEKFVIIPSSINEVLVSASVPPEFAKEMLLDANKQAVKDFEWLSDNIYLYDHGVFSMM